jgi:hypothetical protein
MQNVLMIGRKMVQSHVVFFPHFGCLLLEVVCCVHINDMHLFVSWSSCIIYHNVYACQQSACYMYIVYLFIDSCLNRFYCVKSCIVDVFSP